MVHRTHKNRDKSIHVIMSSLLGLVKIVILSLANKREVTFCDNIRKLNYPTVRFKGRTITWLSLLITFVPHIPCSIGLQVQHF